jgi:hypothetical protein
MKAGRMSAAALGMLLYAGAHNTQAASADSADASPAGTPLYGYFREARGMAAALAQRTVNFKDIRRATVDPVHISFDGGAAHPVVLARLHHAFGDLALASDRATQGEPEVLLRNSDAFVRAKVRLTLGKNWLGFVYADVGAADSALRWQGLAGIRSGHGVELLGGWRHITYHFSPGMGFESLDFKGPFFGGTLAW